jgi:predicted phage terminase large subunit-like protein
VRGWDLAACSELGSAYTAGVKIGKGPDGVFYIADVIRERLEGARVRQVIVTTAEQDGYDCEIALPKDPAQAGKVQAADYISMLAGFRASAEPQTGSKETRAEPLSAQAEAGNVKLVAGAWNDPFLDEAATFPNGSFKDQIDAAANGFARLITRKAFAIASV